MFFGGVFFQLPGDLPYAKGQQKNENFGETFPFSGVFTPCGDQMKGYADE